MMLTQRLTVRFLVIEHFIKLGCIGICFKFKQMGGATISTDIAIETFPSSPSCSPFIVERVYVTVNAGRVFHFRVCHASAASHTEHARVNSVLPESSVRWESSSVGVRR